MYLLSNLKLSKSTFFSMLLALIPFSFIAGNMIININLMLIIFSAIILFNKSLFKIKLFFLDKLILLYFFLIILTAIINDYYFFVQEMSWKGYFSTILKSILFLKYLFLYLILRYLIEEKFVNLKFFFISCLLATIFVSIDIFYQLLNGKDVFGYEIIGSGRKLSGPFGDELIAGGFIQRFFLFSFFILPVFYTHLSKKYSKFLIPILFLIFFIGIILSGNRMPLLLFLSSIVLIIIFQKETRKYFFSFITIFFIIFFIIYNVNEKVKDNFLNFAYQIAYLGSAALGSDIYNSKAPYIKEFASFYDTWLINKYIGGGIKNFRYYCHVRPNIDKNSKFVCNMHPHNYYLEILTETGMIGFLVIVTIFLNILYISFYKKYFSSTQMKNNIIIVPLIFLFIIEIFPIKSTGSFFTTGNTTYLFLIIGILVGLIRKQNLIENQK
jgi:O-antigen ligase